MGTIVAQFHGLPAAGTRILTKDTRIRSDRPSGTRAPDPLGGIVRDDGWCELRIRLVVYTTIPRGDVVHAISLAEALAADGHDVELWALSHRGAEFFRPVAVPTVLVPTTHTTGDPVSRWFPAGADALASAMADAPPVDIVHAEDALAARALIQLRNAGLVDHVIRTIHHVNAYADPALLEFQRASIVDVDTRICVSRHWADRIEQEFGITAEVVRNGTDYARYARSTVTRDEAGTAFGWGDRPVVLAVGGIEPRKGSRLLLEAFARARGRLGTGALLVVAGKGGTTPDIDEYRHAWYADAERLGLVVERASGHPADDTDVLVVGAVPEDAMPTLYRAADVLAFPSTREGFGLVVLEALASGLPAVVSDLPVLREYLRDGLDCLMVPPGDSAPLSDALVSAARDDNLRQTLRAGGRVTARRFTWERSARDHERVYRNVLGVPG